MALDIALPIPRTSLATNGIDNNAWYPINPDGLPRGVFKISITLLSDNNQQISYDGITAHDVIQADTTLTVDFETNSTANNTKCTLKKGTIIYVRSFGGGGGAGIIYVSGWFQPYNAHDIEI